MIENINVYVKASESLYGIAVLARWKQHESQLHKTLTNLSIYLHLSAGTYTPLIIPSRRSANMQYRDE